VLLFAFVSSSLGHAAGFYTTTSGAKALGRGGAYTAGVDDLSAQFHNPAGLVRIDDPQIMLDISWVEATSSFQRAGEYTLVGETESQPFEEAKEEGAPFPIPSLAFGTHFGLEDWTFAIGFYPHYAPHQEWPEDGAQRYSLITSTEWQAYGGPTVAHRFNDWLSLGLGLQWTFLRADRTFALSNCIAPTCEDDPTYDIESSVKSLDPFTPSANFGALIEPSDRLSLGLLFQLPISYSAKAKVTTHIPEENPLLPLVDGNDFTDEDATLEVDFPLILKAGADIALSDRVNLELDAGYQGWSRTKEILLTDLDITIPLSQDAMDSGSSRTTTARRPSTTTSRFPRTTWTRTRCTSAASGRPRRRSICAPAPSSRRARFRPSGTTSRSSTRTRSASGSGRAGSRASTLRSTWRWRGTSSSSPT
jgi:long-chain fatty acid transport protein